MAPSASSPRSQTFSPHWDDRGPCQDMALHWKLITKLVRFGSNVLQETAVSLRREETVPSIVMWWPGLSDLIQLLTNDSCSSEMAANLFACARSQRVDMSSKCTCRMMSLNREMVPVISGFPRWNDQLSCSDASLITPHKMITAIDAISSGRATKRCSFFCCTCWTVHSCTMPSRPRVMKFRQHWRRLVTVLLALAVGSPSATYGWIGVNGKGVPTFSSRHTVPSFAVSVSSVSKQGLFGGRAVSSSAGWTNSNCEHWWSQMISQTDTGSVAKILTIYEILRKSNVTRR